MVVFFFFQAEDGIRDSSVTGVQTCALPICNEVDLELADFIDHLADDPATKVIALYVETVRHPARFRAACLKAARAGKPVWPSRSAAPKPAPRPPDRTPGPLPEPIPCQTRCS